MTDDKPKKPRAGKLDSRGAVLTERAKVYREARRRTLDTLEASRLFSMLGEMLDEFDTGGGGAGKIVVQVIRYGRDVDPASGQ